MEKIRRPDVLAAVFIFVGALLGVVAIVSVPAVFHSGSPWTWGILSVSLAASLVVLFLGTRWSKRAR